ncbi:MAG: AzlD domain-containing protein [Frankia sp.]
MTATWITVLAVGAVTMMLKGIGPAVLGGRSLPLAARRVVALVAPALLAALIATQAFSANGALTVDARAVGLGVGAVGAVRGWPMPVVVILAVAATALTRAVD